MRSKLVSVAHMFWVIIELDLVAKGEIVETIKNLQKQYAQDRTGTLNKAKTVKRSKVAR
jgi:hypothetical protein